ncbi:MAG TPA: DPP IV N-terminal domain-containing protein [Herpetosiphonaceae bacterium]
MHVRRSTFFAPRSVCIRGLSLMMLALLVACGGPAAPAEQPTTTQPAQPSAAAAPQPTPTIAAVTPSAAPAETSTAETSAPAETETAAADDSGDQIAYVKENNIWLLDLASGGTWQLTTEGENSDPSWSPDGQTLAFTRMYDGNPEIATIRADGSGLTRITDNQANDLHPAYARDGTLFYARHQQGEETEIEVIKRDASGGETIVYTQPGGLCTPVHLSAAQETQIALSINCGRGYNAFVIDLAANTTTDLSLDYAPTACVYQATFAHTQPRLALITAQDCSPQINTGIATLDLGSAQTALDELFTNREIWALDWSADDQSLVFQKESRSDPDLSGLWLLSLTGDSAEPSQLTKEGTSPAWRP